MQPAEIAQSYDSIAHQWREPFLETNGIHQHEHALQFRPPGGLALDVGSGCSGRFLRLLAKNGYQVEGLALSMPLMTGNFFGCELGEVGGTQRMIEREIQKAQVTYEEHSRKAGGKRVIGFEG